MFYWKHDIKQTIREPVQLKRGIMRVEEMTGL